MPLGLRDREFAKVKDRGGEHRARAAVANSLDEMSERANAARSDDRNRDSPGDSAGEGEIETTLGAVAVHRRQKNFAGAERHHFLRIGKGIEAGRLAPAMGEDFPFAGCRLLGVDRHYNTLVS